MGNDLFNFILSDINGIPALPVFIGNYLLDLLSTFFPLFMLLSSFVMVYIGLTRGSGDWKNTAQQIAPTAVSLAVILGLLSMKTPYSDNSKLQGDFWQDANSYTVVEMMNTFLSFGNIFADALTHKIIYGSISVTPGNASYNGYFPSVLQSLIDSNREDQSSIIKLLEEEGKKTEILDQIDANNAKVGALSSLLIDRLHNLGVVKDFRKFGDSELESIKQDNFFNIANNKLFLASYYERDDYKNKYNNASSAISSASLKNQIGKNEQKDKSYESFSIKDFAGKASGYKSNPGSSVKIENENNLTKPLTLNIDEALALNAKKIEKGQAIPPKLEYVFDYLRSDNNILENDSIEILAEMINSYYLVWDTFNTKIKNLEKEKAKYEKNEKYKAVAIESAVAGYKTEANQIAGRISEISKLYKDYINVNNQLSTITNSPIVNIDNSIKEKVNIVFENSNSANYFDSISIKGGVGDRYIEDLKEQAVVELKPIEYSLIAHMFTSEYDSYEDKEKIMQGLARNKSEGALAIINALNKKYTAKAYISGFFYKNLKDELAKDQLFQASLGYGLTGTYVKLMMPEEKYNQLNYIDVRKKEILTEYDVNGTPDVGKKLKDSIEKNYTGLMDEDSLIHWTDLGKHYSIFKNSFSPMISDIYLMSALTNSDMEGMTTLAKFMQELEPNENANRILTTASIIAGANAVVGVGTIAMNIISPTEKLKEAAKSKSGISSLWDAIKIIGGVYFAILFINVILPAFVWMFVIITYYVEMALYVAIFPIGFMFMIFQSYRQSLHQYINMLLGFILMPIILVSMYFVVLYIDMLLPMFFKQFMPFFGSYDELGGAFKAAFGGVDSPLQSLTAGMFETVKTFAEKSDVAKDAGEWLMSYIGNMIYTLLSMLMSVLLLMTFFRANEYMSKILNVSTVGMDSFQGRETLNKFGSFDKSGLTAGVVGR